MADDDNIDDNDATESEELEGSSAAGVDAESDLEIDYESGRVLGLERWVFFGFLALFAVALWLYSKIVEAVWDEIALYVQSIPEPMDVGVTLLSAVLAILTTVGLYYNVRVREFSYDAASELAKVTWPTKDETWSSTVVVFITSALAAAILFLFDNVWSFLTQSIYL